MAGRPLKVVEIADVCLGEGRTMDVWRDRDLKTAKKKLIEFVDERSSELEVFKPAPVHFCTDFTSTANATVSTYGRDIPRLGTFLQAVKVVQDSHLLNTHPHPQPTRATLPSRHSFVGKYFPSLVI
ncbi:hypothetical protein RF11_15208 [Thelohanellus kitauei]|uniref:Uncharacterized protein n=1 Tax=Thelohanellus kitauei TaxID=669202 RepID=A0A0C2J4F5_THEKT|nr:hypothetical protein RF11_15208 [Thelohanellus kitauei]